ncbi:BadF/BadG/BcrA/BcrD ATPase family protein [Lederbergia lenta]|uniref:BadF/BadG/BcrA/BcrD ATPase family protein n=1 Tax=Lederbergia lenta TaxID=1467 RepID=UPI0020415A8E|nr:BadF/BadG/BcrA/BcrD ATPase family protein [Lederbergia lenta]MCM3109665.1 ATPase [Lederbergia lenta]
MQRSYVIGLEGGGTKTRVMLTDLQGRVLSYQEAGSAHPNKDPHAKQHIQEAVLGAIKEANVERDQAQYLVAGLPGYEQRQDLKWANPLTEIPGLSCPRLIVNDSEVGHAGAFLFEPGIMAISGTGSNVMGRTGDERILFNGSFGHYARTAARFLSYDAVYQILAGQIKHEDQPLIKKVMQFWNVKTSHEFRERASQQFIENRMERDRQFGLMAPLFTEAALENVPLAKKVCDEAVHSLEIGIRLLGGSFEAEIVKVCYIGSVIRSTYIRQHLTEKLQKNANKKYQVVEPSLSPVAGAIVMALKQCEIKIENKLLIHLLQHPQSRIN